jgi:hypothetical protein
MTQQRATEVAKMSLRAAEEQAQRTHYFAPGRSWMERSLNHPYLGLYPMSYMWGKVLPEMARFLVTRPFGLKAPLLGMALANDFMATIQNTMNQDPEARDYFDKRPGMVRLLNMMLPGTPWDMPVVMPVLMRHAAELDADNASRRANGLPEKSLVLGNEMDALIQHAFGLGNFAGDITKAVGEMTGTNASLAQKQSVTKNGAEAAYYAQQAQQLQQLRALQGGGAATTPGVIPPPAPQYAP